MPLEDYRRKRDFARTPEPAPSQSAGAVDPGAAGDLADPPPFALRRRFVVGRHRATRLHYDLRLEIGGVLVSWAVPKGPTLDPDARRMAMHVEDHPIEYLDFEGVIPRGQYGAGDAIAWDWGTWVPERETPDPAAALAAGELKLRMFGEKLHGRFTIVRTGGRGGPRAESGRASEEASGEPWLLIHKRDPSAEAGWDVEDHPRSVRSGRTNDEVAAGVAPRFAADPPPGGPDPDLAAARRASMPRFVEPMQATLAAAAFRDEAWLFEIKWDGYRVQAHVRDGRAELRSRRGGDAGPWFPRFRGPAPWIDAAEAIVDGEVVALDDEGRPDFGLLAERLGDRQAPVVYLAFDLLHLDGWSLIDVPLEARKRLLEAVLRPDARIRYASHVVTEGVAFFGAAAAQGLEGVVAKRRRSRYEPGRRSPDWRKVKVRPEQELVVGGWTPGEGTAGELGALVVGVFEGAALRFAGKVGSGFDARTRRDLRGRLDLLATDAPPFDPPPAAAYRGRWGGELAGVTWTRPELVIRATLGGWSRDGSVRQAAYKGIDADRDPRTVLREQVSAAIEAPAVEAAVSQVVAPAPAPAPKTTPKRKVKAAVDAPAAGADKPAAAPAPDDDPHIRVTRPELAALAAMRRDGPWQAAGRELRLTNLDKILFEPRPGTPDTPVTKRDLVDYFARIAPVMLPHLAGRPLNLQRFPDGAGNPGFWQKQVPASAPAWLTRWHETGFREREDRAPNDHLVADGAAALCWLANQAAFEVHAWTSLAEAPWIPTYALIDIDPGPLTTWDETLTLARLYRAALDHLGVRGYPKLTGSRGVQAWIPLERGRYTYAETSAWVEKLSRAVGATVPDIVSWEWSKANRGGRARLDYTQNAPIKTLVAPYAVRPRSGAPVSAPIAWEELDEPDLAPDRWTIRTVLDRVAALGDPWAALPADRQVLPPL
jgi:bifunctional non-homologous end joining protein LigD